MAVESPVVFIDGRESAVSQIPVDVNSPVWLAGQSLFETIRVYPHGTTGLFRLEQHLERLTRAAARLDWPGCPPLQRLEEWVLRAAAAFREKHSGDGRLRLTVAWTRRDGPPSVTVVVSEYTPVESAAVVAVTPVVIPWTGDETVKVGSRFLYAAAEAKARILGADEALLVDPRGRPVEGAKSNLFVATADGVVTPPAGGGPLAGITRKAVLEIAIAAGFRVWERPIELEELDAGAPFLTNALWGVRPVRAVDGRPVQGPKDVVARLGEMYRRHVWRSLL